MKKPALSVIGKSPIETDAEEQMPWTMNQESDFKKICGLDVFVVTPCR